LLQVAPVVEVKPVLINGPTITVGNLAEQMDVKGAEVVKHLMLDLGIMATITQSIDAETAVQIATTFGKEVLRVR
ncbi:unnamed protein product, partial [Discosporangium mesarthrocarpum]